MKLGQSIKNKVYKTFDGPIWTSHFNSLRHSVNIRIWFSVKDSTWTLVGNSIDSSVWGSVIQQTINEVRSINKS